MWDIAQPRIFPAFFRMMEVMKPYLHGQSLAGAGGGGFMFAISKEPHMSDKVFAAPHLILALILQLSSFSGTTSSHPCLFTYPLTQHRIIPNSSRRWCVRRSRIRRTFSFMAWPWTVLGCTFRREDARSLLFCTMYIFGRVGVNPPASRD